MPRITPVTDDVVAALAAALPAARVHVGVEADADARATLETIEVFLAARRTAGEPLAQEEIIGLGVLLGDAYVRAFGWEWVELDYGTDGTAFATVDPDRAYGNQPLNWVHEIANDADREIALVLAYEMVAAGDLPAAGSDGPLIVH